MEQQIIFKAIQELQKNSLHDITLETSTPSQSSSLGEAHPVNIKRQNKSWQYLAIIRKRIVPSQIARIKALWQREKQYLLLAQYITPRAKEMLMEANIPYIDSTGNIFLANKDAFIYIENKNNPQKTEVQKGAFLNKAGLKVVYQFLTDSTLLNSSYRKIGGSANVSVDTVKRVIHALLQYGFIVKSSNSDFQWHNKYQLFEDWVDAYNFKLRPALDTGNYRFIGKQQRWRNIQLPADSFWGGAVAAEMLLNYLIPDKAIVYTGLAINEIRKNLRLVPSSHGNIKIMENFGPMHASQNCVHPLLIYADLLNENDPRYKETAYKLYDNHVQYLL